MAIWLIAVVAVAPCQCFSPGGQTTTSPARISLLAPPWHCTQPQPDVTTSLWPSGWVPSSAGARLEDNQAGRDTGWIRRLKQRVDPHSAAEIFRRTFGGRL